MRKYFAAAAALAASLTACSYAQADLLASCVSTESVDPASGRVYPAEKGKESHIEINFSTLGKGTISYKDIKNGRSGSANIDPQRIKEESEGKSQFFQFIPLTDKNFRSVSLIVEGSAPERVENGWAHNQGRVIVGTSYAGIINYACDVKHRISAKKK